ncbi:MAG: hypothetical protein R3D65_12855 [Zhengella sp.]|uniref:hypothetical protein n=1 Tax=Zhengella sp. TaxID=2282762 RepID=UPI001D701CD4|nr:hypothetical protein [Notoacmeibacter sp.]MCC0027488.1 hypothetical protein [Brucellaceae bacterium]
MNKSKSSESGYRFRVLNCDNSKPQTRETATACRSCLALHAGERSFPFNGQTRKRA